MLVKDDFMNAFYTAAIDTDGQLEDAKLRLIQFAFSEATVISETEAEIVVPDYTTYADVTLTGASVNVDVEGRSYVQWDAVEFSPTAATNLPQYVNGCAILASDDTLLAVSTFSTPQGLLYADQVLTVLPKFRLGHAGSNNILAYTE